MPLLDIVLSLANIVYLISYSVRDILWLRIMTVVAALLLLPYYYFQPDSLWAAIGWNTVFIAINIFWITKLLLERRPVRFSDEERELYRLALRNFTEHDALKLFRLGTWSSLPAGTIFETQGQPVGTLTLIAEGKVKVELDGKMVDTHGKGRFLGVAAYLSNQSEVAAPVTTTATEPTRVITWPFAKLESQLAGNKDLEVAIEACLGLELAHFLKTARAQMLHPRLA